MSIALLNLGIATVLWTIGGVEALRHAVASVTPWHGMSSSGDRVLWIIRDTGAFIVGLWPLPIFF